MLPLPPPPRLVSYNSASSSSSSCSSSLSSSKAASPSPSLKKGLKRPRGLWRGRAKIDLYSGNRHRSSSPVIHILDLDTDDDDNGEEDFDLRSDISSSTSSKRREHSPDFCRPKAYCWDHIHSEFCSKSTDPGHQRDQRYSERTRTMDTTTTAAEGFQLSSKTTCDYGDWQDLKELFARAAQAYEVCTPSETLPLLRGVIHECHRFLVIYPDPSILFTCPVFSTPTPQEKPVSVSARTEPRERLDWNYNDPEVELPQAPSTCAKYKRCVEIPTSFHTIMGTALFLFGNLIAQAPEGVLDGEPDSPAPYWLAALDVFETGENLPSRTNSQGCCCPEDWRMAIVWGRTLVALADETITRSRKAMSESSSEDALFFTAAAEFAADEHNWPADSPFATIASRRPPVTRRMSLSTASPNDLLVLAMDQFSRGIFHMPHPSSSTCSSTPTFVNGAPSAVPNTQHFSRAKELFTLASEVLFVAERLDDASERQYWASWADSVFNQMKMEANMDSWKGPITRSRGRCWLTVGASRSEEVEDALEGGELEVLSTEKAESARDALTKAVTFFERAVDITTEGDDEGKELRVCLAEALLTLANLTIDESKREGLYSRAQTAAGDSVNLDLMDMSE